MSNEQRYYKVLTADLPTGTRLRTYDGVCASCRSDARRALEGGANSLRAALSGAPLAHREHIVNGTIEVVFEGVRQRLGVRPSRKRAVHVFRTVAACRRFRTEYRPEATGIYLVEHDGEFAHDSFMEWLNARVLNHEGDIPEQLAQIRRNAESYWRAEPPPTPQADHYTETLLSEHVRIVGLLERFAQTPELQ